ncbi:DNA replication complex GINS protein [Wickerhamomyces ciferrii]|uniref:DNA replication complex GINS protein PSF2 n=1 Tax=Wickerhamomyces ciferrii (strain ATCC 14091 / BCRC 22168 / CBS 111 / JCM 3599 / NBRC 0793 / NRRL Y-1031 F-60-10) TaxID=1206466 RepID=K0KWR5_WICCF|nr:DNA replication complex GINS protein [Wickerhamomyces ciferrii]CCH46477.1 DNA replication complex GINS protein [Wickerhamomyces ciferrii]
MNRIQVPIWLAQILKAQRKCNIVPPEWLNLKTLKELYQHEVTDLESFSELPFNWLEISKIFFENAPDDLSDEIHKLKSLIQDLKEIRMIKIKKGLTLINESHLQLDNLSLMEINEIRPFVVSVMGKLTSMSEAVTQDEQEVEDEMESEDDDASMYGKE